MTSEKHQDTIKGASLTPTGEQRAYHILRRHRLWEVFLVNQLEFEYAQAHEAACQLEHSTPKDVADGLAAFLGHPRVNPQGDPIRDAGGDLPSRPTISLAALAAGHRGHVTGYDADATVRSYLDERGGTSGCSVHGDGHGAQQHAGAGWRATYLPGADAGAEGPGRNGGNPGRHRAARTAVYRKASPA